MTNDLPPFLADLDAALEHGFDLLTKAVRLRTAPMHTPVVSTIALDGRPRARVVVLRAFDRERRHLRFHTDIRSDKFQELHADPRIALLFYDSEEKIQLRIEGRATLHKNDESANAAWASSQPMSKLCYAVEPGPGHHISARDDFSLPRDRAESETGRAHFAAVIVTIEDIDFLWLGAAGNRRALYKFGDHQFDARWVVP
ncbi:MAG: pyridoxamine 5'-phosphate oxidase family protein [Hyphomicrobiales bacterium]